MKKEIPFITKIDIPYEAKSLEGLLLYRFNHIIEEGYTFFVKDFNLFCAILIRKKVLENLSEPFKNYIIQDNLIRPEIQFQKISLAMEAEEYVSEKDLKFYYESRLKKGIERKNIIKKEIQRTGINSKKITFENSSYYRELLRIVKDFDDITLINWFVPIVLDFKKFIHIYVKHVEETKFSEGQFKVRSFFDYKHTEILSLVKKILSQEEESIKDHFLLVSVGHDLNDKSKIKDYHRGFGKYPPISFNNDNFRLSIDKNGFIQSFYQIK